MGLRLRKSIKLGNARINLSKSGVGYSYGVKGLRKGVGPTGRTRTTASIPGTGISYVSEGKGGRQKVQRTPKTPFFSRAWVMWAALVLFAPLGIFLLYRQHPDWDKRRKITISAIFAAIWLILLIAGSAETPEDAQDPVARAQVAEAAPQERPESSEPEQAASGQNAQQPESGTPDEPPATDEAPTIIPSTDFAPVTMTGDSSGDKSAPTQTGHAYVGSAESDTYHYPNCRWVKNILPENLIGWDTVEDAQAVGYSPCGTCNPH